LEDSFYEMDFCKFSPELRHEVLVASVRARGHKRALRLRLVSREFATAITDAIFASDILYDIKHVQSYLCAREIDYGGVWLVRGRDDVPEFWIRYLVWRVRSRSRPLSSPMRTIHQVAARIARHRLSRASGGEGGGDGVDDRLDDKNAIAAIRGVCRAFLELGGDARFAVFHATPQVAAPPLDETGADFGRALLSAAAFLNEIDLVRHLLAHGLDPSPR
jgi:hypothetical protein